MLHFIQSKRSPTVLPKLSKENRRDLRALDALSAILIRQHEIAAVVGKPYDGSNIQVIASVVCPSNTDSLLQPDALTTSTSSHSFWSRFTVAPNPRKDKIHGRTDSLINTTSLPIFRKDKDLGIPEELITAAAQKNVRLLEIFLKTQW